MGESKCGCLSVLFHRPTCELVHGRPEPVEIGVTDPRPLVFETFDGRVLIERFNIALLLDPAVAVTFGQRLIDVALRSRMGGLHG